jgi:hypothetical protein
MEFHQLPKASLFIVDAASAQGMPVGGGVDGHHRLAQKQLGRSGQADHRHIGAHLHNGVDIVTIGQYLRPTGNHLPVARWVEPATFAEWKRVGEEELGIAHEFLAIPDVPHTATGSYEAKGDEIMRHHQKTFEKFRK